MPCRQVATYNGVPASSGGHATEAECNQACQEGACCEGTTCTVRPQCQCQCTTGTCCGPDVATNFYGVTGPVCRAESKGSCTARGGVWRCGVNCSRSSDEPSSSPTLCVGSLTGNPEPVFMGVGTTCAQCGNPLP